MQGGFGKPGLVLVTTIKSVHGMGSVNSSNINNAVSTALFILIINVEASITCGLLKSQVIYILLSHQEGNFSKSPVKYIQSVLHSKNKPPLILGFDFYCCFGMKC